MSEHEGRGGGRGERVSLSTTTTTTATTTSILCGMQAAAKERRRALEKPGPRPKAYCSELGLPEGLPLFLSFFFFGPLPPGEMQKKRKDVLELELGTRCFPEGYSPMPRTKTELQIPFLELMWAQHEHGSKVNGPKSLV